MKSVRWVFVNSTQPPRTAQNDTVDYVTLAGGRHLLFSSTTKAVTPFAGLASFMVWLRQIGFLHQVAHALLFRYASSNAIPITHTFPAFLLSVVVGAPRFAHCDWLRFDSAFHALPYLIVARMTTALKRRYAQPSASSGATLARVTR